MFRFKKLNKILKIILLTSHKVESILVIPMFMGLIMGGK